MSHHKASVHFVIFTAYIAITCHVTHGHTKQ